MGVTSVAAPVRAGRTDIWSQGWVVCISTTIASPPACHTWSGASRRSVVVAMAVAVAITVTLTSVATSRSVAKTMTIATAGAGTVLRTVVRHGARMELEVCDAPKGRSVAAIVTPVMLTHRATLGRVIDKISCAAPVAGPDVVHKGD